MDIVETTLEQEQPGYRDYRSLRYIELGDWTGDTTPRQSYDQMMREEQLKQYLTCPTCHTYYGHTGVCSCDA